MHTNIHTGQFSGFLWYPQSVSKFSKNVFGSTIANTKTAPLSYILICSHCLHKYTFFFKLGRRRMCNYWIPECSDTSITLRGLDQRQDVQWVVVVIGFSSGPGMNSNNHNPSNPSRLSKYSKTFTQKRYLRTPHSLPSSSLLPRWHHINHIGIIVVHIGICVRIIWKSSRIKWNLRNLEVKRRHKSLF